MSKAVEPEKLEDHEAMDAMWGGAASGQDAASPHLQWLRDEKYSMFIHWGLYSHLGGEYRGKTYHGIGEWIMHKAMAGIPVDEYKALAGEFNPEKFDARAIVQLAKDAGMRCIVVTAKHHEGFAMFDSAASDFTITRATPFKRDPMKELADACQVAGIRLGFYYSQFQDWIEPDAGPSPEFDAYFERKALPQIQELLTNYGPISVVWFDTPGSMGKSHSQRLVELVHELQPGCLVNSRVGNGLGDYSTLGDMELPTRTPDDGMLYECIDTTNDSWAFAHQDKHWKSATTIAQSLVRVIARGCSFMLNIGPAPDGSVPAPAAQALAGAGQWIAANAEAVYGTGASPFPPFCWGDCTIKGNQLYLHIFDWPRSGRLQLAGLKGVVRSATCLSNGDNVPFEQQEDCLTLILPSTGPSALITVVRLTFDVPPAALYQDHIIDGESPAVLPAEYARREGVTLRSMRWMETFGEWKRTDNLTEWFTQSKSEAGWDINVLKDGPYVVTVEYACTEEDQGSEWLIKSATDSLAFSSLESGCRRANAEGKAPRMRYLKRELGVINLQVGRQALRMMPKTGSSPGNIHLRQIKLEPWE